MCELIHLLHKYVLKLFVPSSKDKILYEAIIINLHYWVCSTYTCNIYDNNGAQEAGGNEGILVQFLYFTGIELVLIYNSDKWRCIL